MCTLYVQQKTKIGTKFNRDFAKTWYRVVRGESDKEHNNNIRAAFDDRDPQY